MKSILIILLLALGCMAQRAIPVKKIKKIKKLKKKVTAFQDKGHAIHNIDIVAVDTTQNIVIGNIYYIPPGDTVKTITSSDCYFYYRGSKKNSPFNLTKAEKIKLRDLQIRKRK